MQWVDLCDPDEQSLRAALPAGIHELTITRLLRRAEPDDEPRPRLEARGHYVFGVLACPLLTDDGAIFQEVDVVATLDTIVTVRKIPPKHPPTEFEALRTTA